MLVLGFELSACGQQGYVRDHRRKVKARLEVNKI